MGAQRSMVGVRLIGLVMVGSTLAAAPSATWADRKPKPKADPRKAEAKAHLDAGLRLYNTQDFAGAIAAWRQAYVLDGNPQTLFAIGQAQRLAGDCQAALNTYAAVLREQISDTQADEVRKVVAVCEEQLKVAAPPVVDPVVIPTPPEPVVAPAPTPAPPVRDGGGAAPWYKDGITLGLLGGGAAGLAVGATFFVLAGSSEDAADAATSYDTFAAAADQAAQRRTISAVGLVGGGALLVAGVLYTFTRDQAAGPGSAEAATSMITPSLGPDGASLTWLGRF